MEPRSESGKIETDKEKNGLCPPIKMMGTAHPCYSYASMVNRLSFRLLSAPQF